MSPPVYEANRAIPTPGKSRMRLPPTLIIVGPAAVTLLLWVTSPNPVSLVQGIAAYLLLLFAVGSYWHWQRSGSRGLPMFSAVVAMYWLYFGVQVFWGSWMALDWKHPKRSLSDLAITESMLLVVFGVAFLWAGMRSKLGSRAVPKHFPGISWRPLTLLYIQGLALAGTLMTAYSAPQAAQDAGLQQVVLIIESTVSMTAIVILLRRVIDKKAGATEKVFLWVVIALRVVFGISSGLMGSAVGLAMVCGLVYLQKRRKLPIAALACVLPYMLFFQVGKAEFRQTFWYGDPPAGAKASTVEKIEFWASSSLKTWRLALEDPGGQRIPTLLAMSLSRSSLLSQSANVMEQTPALVPYQYGSLYSYLGVALIPRFLWPEKPSMNEANQFYQVAYGVTRVKDLNHISIAVGALTEGYINFSWFGTALVMFLVGILLEFWNSAFLSENSTLLAVGIGIAMVPQFLLVEFQLAQYLSGLIQHVLLTMLIFLPITHWRRRTAVRRRQSREFGIISARS